MIGRLFAAATLAASLGVVAPTTHVYLIGDSTMADRPSPETNPEQGWGQHLAKFFDGTVEIHNFAVNGRSTKSFIDERKWANVLGQLKRGDYLFIQFGHNDEKVEDSTRYAAAATTFRANLERFVAEARSKGARPVLFTPIVRRKFDEGGALVDTHGAYPDAVRGVATRLDVPLIDLQTLTGALVAAAGPELSKRYYVWSDGRQDDTHLSPAGATEVARLAARGLTSVDGQLGAHVRLK